MDGHKGHVTTVNWFAADDTHAFLTGAQVYKPSPFLLLALPHELLARLTAHNSLLICPTIDVTQTGRARQGMGHSGATQRGQRARAHQ